MKMMGIDLGYRDETTVVIIDDGDIKDPIKFRSMRHQHFEAFIHEIYNLALKYEIQLDDIHAPRHPEIRQELKKRGYK